VGKEPPEHEPLGKVSDIDIAARVEIGETFEFGSTHTLDINDVIGIKASPYTLEIYGLAKIISSDSHGFYQARRID
jgi:hypothetical protein